MYKFNVKEDDFMDNVFKKMKTQMGDKLIETSCNNCEFNFGTVCVGHTIRKDNGKDTYGMPMEEAIEMFPKGCEDFGISLKAFIEQEQINGR